MLPVATKYAAESASPPRELALARLAAAQYGVVALAQLVGLGLSPAAVRSRVARGRLHRVHQGVYAVGHSALSREGRWLAAVLACGPSAVLSHRSAAALWDLRPTSRTAIDVTAPRGRGRSRPGIDPHGANTLEPSDCTEVGGIPCTTVARTLLDLAEVVDQRSLRRACERAETLRVLDVRSLSNVLGRAAGRRGAAALQATVDEDDPSTALTRSELERRFIDLCLAANVPRPAVNSLIALGHGRAVEADFAWPTERLIVETDGHRTHGTRRAFERDRNRDRRLLLAGWRVVRFTWGQVDRAPGEVIATLRALL